MSDRKRNESVVRWGARRAGVTLGLLATLGWAGTVWAYDGAPVSGGGSISGTVKYKGAPPPRAKLDVNKDTEVCGTAQKESRELVVAADGGIQYAVVAIPSITKGKPFAAQKSQLDQHGCEYVPHVTLLPAGGELEILNSDGILHNIHTYPQENKNAAVNRAQPKFKKSISETFKEPERIKLACDVHGWMQGWLIVENNPYYAVTDDKGQFKLTDVPAGDYELTVWHEKLGTATQKVSVKAGADTAANFELAPK